MSKIISEDIYNMLVNWSDSDFVTAASGEYGEDLKAAIEGAFARQADRIAELEAEVERLTINGIHTCHDECQRVACVLRRRIAELEEALVKAARDIQGYKDALAQVGELG